MLTENRQLHVFATKKAGAAHRLATMLRSLIVPQATGVTDPYQSRLPDAPSSAASSGSVHHARFLGDAAVSSKKFWSQKAHAAVLEGLLLRPKDERTVDDMFAAAAAVGGIELEAAAAEVGLGAGASSVHADHHLRNEVGIFATTSGVRFVDVLSYDGVCEFHPSNVVEIRTALPPGVTLGDRARVLDTIPAPDKQVLEKRLESGELTSASAIDEALAILEATTPRLVLIMHKNAELGNVKVATLFCTGGISYATDIIAAIETERAAVLKEMNDPFHPLADDFAEDGAGENKHPLPEAIQKSAELDRSTITAVEPLGHGQFGEVYLANRAVPSGSAEATKLNQPSRPCRRRSPGRPRASGNASCSQDNGAQSQLQRRVRVYQRSRIAAQFGSHQYCESAWRVLHAKTVHGCSRIDSLRRFAKGAPGMQG